MCGSIKNGYDSNPSSDPTFESAYNRYGELFGAACANQCCINGLVVDSKKKGRPIAQIRNFAMVHVGLAPGSGCQLTPGPMGVRQK